jgi:glucose-6-phosphate isomerase
MHPVLELEYYPRISQSHLSTLIALIKENKPHWGAPFFMDVYSHVDLEKIHEVCDPIMETPPENLIVLGTGGSIQTMMALEGFTQCNFIPVVSSRPRELATILQFCEPEESFVIPISRGGNTLDVNSTLDIFSSYPMLGLSSQGPMFEYLKKKKIPILPVPDLSGRFAASVTNVALVPAYLAGIDIEKFLAASEKAYTLYRNLDNPNENIALQFASHIYTQYKNGYRNCFVMPYSSYLEGSAGLFVQEISESSGKDGRGMMGTKQEAPLCQHSVLELLLGGSKGHTTPFLWVNRSEPENLKIENPSFDFNNQTALDIINYQADATFQALLTQKIPSAMLNLKEFNIQSIAQLIAFIQSSIYYFCLLLDVNWESNPLVNTGKQICNTAIKTAASIEQRKSNRENIASKQFSEDMH